MPTINPTIQPNVTCVSTEGVKASYAVGTQIASFAVSATDVWQIIGSASKTIKINRIQITADASGLGTFDMTLVKRITANTGGTVAALVPIPYDSYDPVATATLQTYSVNPSALGTGTMIRCDSTALPGAAATGYPYNPLIWDFGTRNVKCPTLRGVGESLAINLQMAVGQTIPAGLTMYIDVEFTEE
jgi:hypothetical protein